MKRVFFCIAALLAAGSLPALGAADAKLDAPPAGLSPSTVTVGQIFKAYDAATGVLERGTADTSLQHWHFTKAGLPGTEDLVRSGRDYYSRISAGPLTDEYGQLLGHRWHRDPNGVVSAADSKDFTSFEMLLLMREFDVATDPKSDVKVAGETAQPKPAYVLEVRPSGEKHPSWFYFDKSTGLIDRIEEIVEKTRVTISYDDYRTTKGLAQPWHVHYSEGDDPSLDDDFVRDTMTVGGQVDVTRFAPPRSSVAFAQYTGSMWLPAHVIDDGETFYIGKYSRSIDSPNTVIRLTIDGRGYDFALSAAAPSTLIDFDVAQSLHLSSYGQVTHDRHGAPVAYGTILPRATAGALTLTNLAVEAVPFHYHVDYDTKIVGLLGYDFLSTGVFKIDFINGTVMLTSPQYYDTHLPDTDAEVVPLTFDDGYPFFSGDISGHESSILIDNDFDWSWIFGDFTQSYPDIVKDQSSGKEHASTTVPFADSKSYGRDVDVWFGVLDDVHFGPAHFRNFGIMATDMPIELGGRDVDAVMGGDLLQYYDMYLDFPHSRILLKPNKRFFQTFQIAPEKP